MVASVVARDVIKVYIAEAAFLPIAAVRDGQLVPAAVRPETVHGVEHVQQRQIVVQRQAGVGGRAALGEGDIGLFEVDVLMLARIRAHQLIERPLVLQMFDERKQRTFASIERYEIEVVEYARLVHGAQLGIAITAAQYRDDGRVGLLDGLRDAKRAVNVAGKRRGDEHQVRLMLRQRFERQRVQECIHQIVRRTERRLQLIERRLARRQRFCIAHELEARVDGIADDVREVVEIKGGNVLGAILQSQCTKGPVERVAVLSLVCRCSARATQSAGLRAGNACEAIR